MRDSKSTYTSTCDKCGKTLTSDRCYPPLRSIYLPDMRGDFSSADCHRHFMDLCEECFKGLLEHLGAEKRYHDLVEEAARYRSYGQ
jgi:hypothetical protein